MSKPISPLVAALHMEPHPEGGWYKEMWKANFQIPKPVLPDAYSGPRFAASSTYFLLHPGEFSEWHVVHSDELWLYHSGSPIELKLGGSGEEPGEETVIIVGADVEKGESPQALVPGGVWQTARPLGDEPVLVTCVVAPGFHFDDFKLYSRPQE